MYRACRANTLSSSAAKPSLIQLKASMPSEQSLHYSVHALKPMTNDITGKGAKSDVSNNTDGPRLTSAPFSTSPYLEEFFGTPMASRMKGIAPFHPFEENGQAVMVHKFLVELAEKVRKPIEMDKSAKQYLGHVNLKVKSDGKLCKYRAAESHIKELGARRARLTRFGGTSLPLSSILTIRWTKEKWTGR